MIYVDNGDVRKPQRDNSPFLIIVSRYPEDNFQRAPHTQDGRSRISTITFDRAQVPEGTFIRTCLVPYFLFLSQIYETALNFLYSKNTIRFREEGCRARILDKVPQ